MVRCLVLAETSIAEEPQNERNIILIISVRRPPSALNSVLTTEEEIDDEHIIGITNSHLDFDSSRRRIRERKRPYMPQFKGENSRDYCGGKE